jgi:hypothetical protein
MVTCGMREDSTTDPVVADLNNYYKVELWTRDDFVERMLFAGTSLDSAREVFADYARRRPASRLTIRQRMRVLEQSPKSDALPDF